jgi:hypothetical protein
VSVEVHGAAATGNLNESITKVCPVCREHARSRRL